MGLMQNFFNWYHDNGIIPNVWKGATGQLSQEKINSENLEYQKERNLIEDARYENETAYNRAFAEEQRAYNRAFAEEEQAYNRAFAEEEQAYKRAFAEDEKSYQRNWAQDERAYNRAFAEEQQAYNRAFAEEQQAYNRAFAEDERFYQRNWAQNERSYQRDWALNERDYQRSLQQTIFDREDTAIARQAEALRAQGINPLSQSMNGLGAGSIVSSSAPGSSSPGSSFLPSSSSPGSSVPGSSVPGSSSPGSSTPGSSRSPGSISSPALSGRGGRALQKAMITSQGINGLLAPILQTLNTVDSLKGNGIQRDVLNAQAVKTQAEANMAVMHMFDTANKLNLKDNSFFYGVNKNKQYNFKVEDNAYNPYFYSPQLLNNIEGKTKYNNYVISNFNANVAKLQERRLDSIGDATKYLTGKLKNKGADEQVLDSFTSIIESLLLKAFK